jgi:penicillin-binding protein 1A
MQKVYADASLGYSQEETFNIPEDFNPCAQKTLISNFAEEQQLDESFGF